MARPPRVEARHDLTRYRLTVHRPGQGGQPRREWFDDLEEAQERAAEIIANGEGVPTITAREVAVAPDLVDGDESPLVSLVHVRDLPETPELEGVEDVPPPSWYYRPIARNGTHRGRVQEVPITLVTYQYVCDTCGKRGPAFIDRTEAARHEQMHLDYVANGPYDEVLEDEQDEDENEQDQHDEDEQDEQE